MDWLWKLNVAKVAHSTDPEIQVSYCSLTRTCLVVKFGIEALCVAFQSLLSHFPMLPLLFFLHLRSWCKSPFQSPFLGSSLLCTFQATHPISWQAEWVLKCESAGRKTKNKLSIGIHIQFPTNLSFVNHSTSFIGALKLALSPSPSPSLFLAYSVFLLLLSSQL